ncbi:capsid protein [Bacillus glycinifermentans]|uniref:capsid protein n=1 Tax=Bacillus glycinifermentans TaxID=1664069 RepID=UPI001582FC7D|nr:capsid protein [Bacillus glycinifermentans]NUJ19289.1 capsid protein [Bacillus glycinifermentans]
MAALNYAEQYQQALDQPYKEGRKFNELFNIGNRNIRWTGGKTVQIPKITVGGMVDVNRDSIGSYTRNVDNSWETKTLTHDREFRTLIDPMDVDETNMAVTIANITNVFNTEQKIPEMDKYMASKLYAEFTGFGGTADTTVIDETNVLKVFDGYMEQMDEAEVPGEGRLLYATPAYSKILKNAAGLTREFDVNSNNGSVRRGIGRLDDVQIITVPSARMKTVYNFTNGAVPDQSAQQINMILVHPSAVIAPEKYDFVSLEEPGAATGGKYLYYERHYYDVFLYEEKVPGIIFNVTAPTP